ncbi:hypothetical protein BSZ35_11165 [Salinibacter sp. 10B]|uniref:hypothetical protein n=1 Tax=Salinibacter sp. 10B TaxID=1923971 RepID=UPI000CF3AFDE|nr:hypothetical protein [Salinibacter sp. 10B]PQJ35081.1 hypothetical protein BSZ35_11165 [Salinibacter sp. 10B]
MASWLHRILLAGLLLAAYLFAWTPARTAWVTHLATPVLEYSTSPEVQVSARARVHTIRVQAPSGAKLTYMAPAGVKFLLPGLFLTVFVVARPRLGLFFGGHLFLGGVVLLLAVGGVTGMPGGLILADFVQQYGIDAYSLTMPTLVLVRSLKTQNT